MEEVEEVRSEEVTRDEEVESAILHLHTSAKDSSDPLSNALQLNLVQRGVKRKKLSGADKRPPLIITASITRCSGKTIMMWEGHVVLGFLHSAVNGSIDTEQHSL